MGNYIEIQSRRIAHDLVLLIHKMFYLKGQKSRTVENLKNSASNVAAELFDAHGRLFDDEKLKHISKSRGYLYEVKYYLNLLNDLGKVNRYSKRKLDLKIELLDRLLVSMIRSKRQYKIHSQRALF